MNIFYFKLSKPLSVSDYRYFDPNQNSQVVLVFVLIQKTGGTYVENALTREGVFGLPCQSTDFKKHAIVIKIMILAVQQVRIIYSDSDYGMSTGWLCGLHHDNTDLKEGLPKKLNKLERRSRKRRSSFRLLLLQWLHCTLAISAGATSNRIPDLPIFCIVDLQVNSTDMF